MIIFFKSIFLDLKTLKKFKSINGSAIYINIFPDDPFDTKNPVISNQSFIKTINEFDFFFAYGQKKLSKNKKKDSKQNLYIYPLDLIVFQYLN